ncbi:MAG TPA: hypothetical protein PLP08_01015, partial [Plasticicumulans sp.]
DHGDGTGLEYGVEVADRHRGIPERQETDRERIAAQRHPVGPGGGQRWPASVVEPFAGPVDRYQHAPARPAACGGATPGACGLHGVKAAFPFSMLPVAQPQGASPVEDFERER